MERSSDIAPDTSSEAADTIDYAATPAAGNTAPHPARNIDLICGDAIAAPRPWLTFAGAISRCAATR